MVKQIENIAAYAAYEIEHGNVPQLYAKFARITAREGKVGEKVDTIIGGKLETSNEVKNAGDMVVTGVNGEEYIVDAATFAKKYEADPDAKPGVNQFRPKGGAQKFIDVNEDISFKAPWGEDMNIAKGGKLNVTNLLDVYGIAKDEFHQTYKPCDANGKIIPMNDKLKPINLKFIGLDR